MHFLQVTLLKDVLHGPCFFALVDHLHASVENCRRITGGEPGRLSDFLLNKRGISAESFKVAGFVCADRDTLVLMHRGRRERVPKDHLAHFIMEAVGLIDLHEAKFTGSHQTPKTIHPKQKKEAFTKTHKPVPIANPLA